MLETSREMGHALGATVSAIILAMALPSAIVLLSDVDARPFYVQGFQFAALSVVFVLLAGAAIAYFHREVKYDEDATPAPQPQGEPSYQASSGGDDD